MWLFSRGIIKSSKWKPPLGSIFHSFGSMCSLQSLISVAKEHFKNDIAESICSSFKARGGFPEKQSVELSIKIHKCVSISVTWRITIGKAAVKTCKGGGNYFKLSQMTFNISNMWSILIYQIRNDSVSGVYLKLETLVVHQ